MTDWQFSEQVKAKARKYLYGGRVFIDPDPTAGVFWIKGSRTYRVQTDAYDGRVTYATCTCPHGTHNGLGQASCSHAAAALLALRDHFVLAPYSPV